MNLTTLQLYEYQASLRELLKQYETINDKVKKCVDFHLHNDRVDGDANKLFNNIMNSIKQEIKNIDKFELRMAVVAPMKSGKSTIINALVGDNILPTRGNAMTTLPTEVVFNRDSDQPTLVLTDDAIVLFVQFQNEIRRHMNQEDVEDLLENQSHLVQIAYDIIQSERHPFFRPLNYTIELKNIQATLTIINDLIRIFLIVSGKRQNIFHNVSLKPFLEKNIRLEVPVAYLCDEYLKDIHISIGSLTIVDTPGPNEAAASEELREIVREELQKAALIVLVLNFTSMGTEADQKIYEDILSIREANVDSDCIYVIVNKVDQRRKNDMKKDDVKKFIATKYKISEKTNEPSDRRIFEMKAVHCLTFRRFMKELEDLKKTNAPLLLKHMATGQYLVKELYPFHESDEDEEIGLDRLCIDATRMWKSAGLKEFIEGPINDLFKKLAPRSLQSALNVCFRTGNQLRSDVNNRRKLLNESKEELEKECENIQNDCNEIAKVEEKNRQKLRNTLTEVREKIDEIMKKVLDKYEQQPVSVSQKAAQELSAETKKYYWRNTFGTGLIVGGLIAATIISGGSAALAVAAITAGTTTGTTIIRNTDDDKKFESKEEARKFLDNLNEEIYQSCKTMYDSVRNEIEELCKTANLVLGAHIKGTTSDIIGKANERLQKKFNIELIPLETLTNETTKVEINIEHAIQKYRPLWGYSLFGRKAEVSIEEEIVSEVTDIKLQISRKELTNICIKSVNHYIETFRKNIDKHFNEVLVKTFESYFEKLNAYVRDYKEQVLDTLHKKTVSKEKQEQYNSALKMILEEIETTYTNLQRMANELGINLNH